MCKRDFTNIESIKRRDVSSMVSDSYGGYSAAGNDNSGLLGGEIFVRPELRRIDENADNNDVGIFFGNTDQRKMPVMQISHRRNKADVFAGLDQQSCLLLQLFRCIDNLHGYYGAS